MNYLVNQPTGEPTEKVKAVAIFGALVTVSVFVLGQFGIVVPPEVSSNALSAFTALFAIGVFVVGYFKKNKGGNI